MLCRITQSIVLLLSLATCSALFAETIPEKKRPVKIGVIGILSGPYSEVGKNIIDGLQLAHLEHTQSGSEPSFELVVEDDQFQSKHGVAALKKLTEIDRVKALINTSSPTFDAIYPLVSRRPLPVMQLGEPGSEPVKDNVFFVPPPLIASAVTLGEHFRERAVPADKIAVIYSELKAFVRLRDALIESYGAEITSTSAGDSELNSLVLRLLQRKPEHLVVLLPAAQGAQVIREVVKRERNRPTLYFDSSFIAARNGYEELLGELTRLDEDLVSVLEFGAEDDFIDRFTRHYDRAPGVLAEVGYDAFFVLKETYSPDPEKWIANIAAFKGRGASGAISFNEFGQRTSEARVVSIGELLGDR